MLKMTLEKAPESATLKLEGKLTAPWADELDRTWRELVSGTPAQSVVVDLSGVTFVDAEGKTLLDWMSGQGAELRGAHLMTKYIIEEIGNRRNGSRGSGG